MTIKDLLTEASLTFRDSKGVREKALNWFSSKGAKIENISNDKAAINGLVAAIAKAAGKKMTSGTYTLTDADFRKIAELDLSFVPSSTLKKVGIQSAKKTEPKVPEQVIKPSKNVDTVGEWVTWLNSLATNDYQGRKGSYPASGRPDSIDVYSDIKNPDKPIVELVFAFKNTSQSTAERWVENNVVSSISNKAKGVKLDTTLNSYQTGDYKDDWVDVNLKVAILDESEKKLYDLIKSIVPNEIGSMSYKRYTPSDSQVAFIQFGNDNAYDTSIAQNTSKRIEIAEKILAGAKKINPEISKIDFWITDGSDYSNWELILRK